MTESNRKNGRFAYGIIAPWKLGEPILIGGGNQFSLPFTMDMLEKLRILDIQY